MSECVVRELSVTLHTSEAVPVPGAPLRLHPLHGVHGPGALGAGRVVSLCRLHLLEQLLGALGLWGI